MLYPFDKCACACVCVQVFQTCQPRVKKKRRRNSKYDLKIRLMCFSSERPSPGSDRMIKAVHMLRRINWQRQFPHGLVHSPAFSGQLFILTETPQQKNNQLNFFPPFLSPSLSVVFLDNRLSPALCNYLQRKGNVNKCRKPMMNTDISIQGMRAN